MDDRLRAIMVVLGICLALGFAILITSFLLGGCVEVERGGIVVTPDVPIASPGDTVAASQPVNATAHTGDNSPTKIIQIPITATGSGWPLVAVAGLVALAVFLWLRAAKQRDVRTEQAATLAGVIEEAEPAVQKAIKSKLGDAKMPDNYGFKKMLYKRGIRKVQPEKR